MTIGKLIDGKAFAADLRAQVAEGVAGFMASQGRKPGLAVVLVGEDPASAVYVKSKGKMTVEVGMESFEFRRPASIGADELLELIEELNGDPRVDGILVQLPLPKHLDEQAVIAAIDPAKDVDGFHVINSGRLAVGLPALVPCTPLGCLMLLKDELGDLSGLEAVVVGRSNIVGKPMAALLLAESCTVTIAHSRTRDLASVVHRADIVVAAVGRPEMIKGEWIKPGATVIDVGINRVAAEEEGKSRIVGDVATAEAISHVRAITPVPGGVGPMTIAVLLRNTLVAACMREGLSAPEGL
ncbi:MAG: bifunctional methylenetetrahydrofolate dehydrogenase/methenyltetrahydrofolate cyclohydrolase FolD [Sphingobium sp.]|jgi:methylenetetrahydrofolate dehydrogenase (NADP+)/methenyltetrahydrofolate cyclohydrolase|nr:bifunctional methylenetetrahydrofolate dehydrogenase/methenyltetrahydrofolate cyclohydrolase FolD [Sphingobium sp.]MCI1272136.1 bifunctional methylenetetrahydrofolate dehydrogenase/methenyltetrahydrofolate cyclohydrolase FolD [Sphingobium sp.]MCI1757162.1 bifunctional methylenetetrahydrofolate dehydrogenase/methenyltetrahydrofolate cyclohydrolase FolD [Sphingobium sp.]MCI2054246.1 bifunctional methylenetetrahydrofolate dehydrogenase/methenyltetrahydrofolate cyclohydrolase FolD [Sphingobium sp